MESWQVILIIFVLIAGLFYPIWGRLLKRGINRKFAQLEGDLAVKQHAEHVLAYARGLVIDADATTVNALADAVALKRKGESPRPGVWHLRGVDKNAPIIVESAPEGGSTVLRVTQPAIINGGPGLSQEWSGFRDTVAGRAMDQGFAARFTGE